MADVRYRIQRPHGGEIREIGDSALPFFPGWLIVETINGPPAVPVPALVVSHDANPNAVRPDTQAAVIWFGTVQPNNLNVARGDKWVNPATASRIIGDYTPLPAGYQFRAGDLVTYQGSAYRIKVDHTKGSPQDVFDNWELLVAKADPATIAQSSALKAAFGTPEDRLALTRIERQTVSSLAEATRRNAARAADATTFTEAWANFSAWIPGAGATLTGDGRWYGSSAGMGKAINVPVGGRALIRAVFNYTAAGSTAYIGVNNQATNWTPVAGETKGIYIGVNAAGANTFYKGSEVTQSPTSQGGSMVPGTTYLFTIAIDELTISMSVQELATTQLIRSFSIPRSAMPGGPAINNLNMTCGPLANSSWGPVAIVSDLAPPPKAQQTINGIALFGSGRQWMFHRLDPDTGIRHLMQVPGTYDPRVPAPVCLFLHQAGSGHAGTPYFEARMANVVTALRGAGYIIASSDNGLATAGGGSSDKYGNQAGLDDYAALVKWVRSQVSTGPLFLLGPSLGGEFVQNLLAQRKVGGIAAVASICPSTDLKAVEANPTYTTAIRDAYGATAADFDAKIVGYNPIAHSAIALRGVPQRFYVASDDTVVPPAVHVTPMVTKLAGFVPECDVITTTGGHLASSLYQGSDLVAFYDRYR